MTGRARRVIAALFFAAPLAADAMTLARHGAPRAVIVVPENPIPAEATAAAELGAYLEKVSGARFEIVPESAAPRDWAQIHVGPTALALRLGLGPSRMGDEEWAIMAEGDLLVLAGGRPRGTLYAVYRFLEDEVGVRWWNPWEETVPSRATIRVQDGVRRGRPAFVHRDMSGVQDSPAAFRARSRLNGYFARLPWSYGGFQQFATPWFAHSFYYVVPPDRYFETHPGYFAERAGFRAAGRSQLCLTNPDLPAILARTFAGFADRAASESRAGSEPEARLFDFSQNDWGGKCTCERCAAAAALAGSESGPLLEVLNATADLLRGDYPNLRITTLAYTYTFAPPKGIRPRDEIVVRLSGYGKRDFAKAVVDPGNEQFRDAVVSWSGIARHLWIWDYAVVFFGNDRGLPLPSYRYYASDLRFYRDHRVEGVFVQHEFPIAADLRDLKVWMMAKLLEDPDRDPDALIRDFTEGYYGTAGREVRRYLRLLERTLALSPAFIAVDAAPESFTFLTPEFAVEAGAIFDRAAAAVRNDPVLARRVRHARLTLDYATLYFWNAWRVRIETASHGSLERGAVVDRYRSTWLEQVDLRLDPSAREAARAEVEEEIASFGGEAP